VTWADFTATGIGGDGILYRFVAEGSRYQFVESEEMVGATYGASLLPAIVTWSALGGVVTAGQVDPLGGTDAATLTDADAGNYVDASCTTTGYVSGEPIAVEVWIKQAPTAAHFLGVNLTYDASFTLQIMARHDIGEASVTFGTASGVEMVEAVAGWWRLRFMHAGAAASTVTLSISIAAGFDASFPSANVTATGAITVYGSAIKIPDGVTRVGGLLREGLGFSESAYLAGAELAISINAIRITETPYPYLDSASSIFAALPSTKCYLASTLETAATSMVVDSAADLAVGDFVHSATEVIEVTALAGTTATVARGRWRTTAQRHTVTTSAGRPAVRPLRDDARVWAGRRCWLYAHGASETGVLDEGAIVWRGRLADNPTLDADSITWNLPIGSRWDLLDQEIGADLDKPRALRGAYYPGAFPFEVSWLTSNTGTQGGPYTTAGLTPTTVRVAGHYETNAGFADALVAALNAASATFEFSWVDVAGQWELVVTIPSTARYLEMAGGSPIDGWFSNRLVPFGDDGASGRDPGVGTVIGDAQYFVAWSDAPARRSFIGTAPPTIPLGEMRRIPRSVNAPNSSGGGDPADVISYPTSTAYLDDVSGIGVGDTLMISEAGGGDDAVTRTFEVASVDTATGSVVAAEGRSLLIVAAGSATWSISVSKTLGDPTGCTLADFRDALIAAAPEGANDATTPWVLGDDLADWDASVVEAAGARDFLLRRLYAFHQGVRTSDIIKHECRAYGLFPHLDADFKVALRPLTLDTASVPLSRYIDADDGTILTEDSFGEMQSGEDGNVNVVEFARGYDPTEDKHTGASIFVVTVEGVSETKKRRILEIKPKVRPVGLELTPDDAYRMSDPVRTMFGGLIQTYTFAVPGTFWSVLIGDAIVITSPQMPYGGARGVHDPGAGMTTRTATVVGREWDLERGTGKLTVLVTGLNVAGYAPTARAVTWTGAGTTFDVECESARYAPSGGVDVSYFTAGDRVRAIEWDAASPAQYPAEVIAVDADNDTLSLEFDGAIVPGATVFNIVFDESDLVVAAQRSYGYVASTSRRIADGGVTGTTARVFAP
jgi:hypothetical protein